MNEQEEQLLEAKSRALRQVQKRLDALQERYTVLSRALLYALQDGEKKDDVIAHLKHERDDASARAAELDATLADVANECERQLAELRARLAGSVSVAELRALATRWEDDPDYQDVDTIIELRAACDAAEQRAAATKPPRACPNCAGQLMPGDPRGDILTSKCKTCGGEFVRAEGGEMGGGHGSYDPSYAPGSGLQNVRDGED